MNWKHFLLAALVLANASCASTSLQPVSRMVRAGIAMDVDRNTRTGDLLVSNFYYGGGIVDANPALLRSFDARARQAGCLNGATPRRAAFKAEASSYEAPMIFAYYVCR